MIKERDSEIKRLRLDKEELQRDNNELQRKYEASCNREAALTRRVGDLEKKVELLQVGY